ncbi:uncharacterized protein [Amphiura filiformis]|uniref:uncharacterized protein n=1 Tax=Amphiura filiformis TaxID=82378 RepID=UPI003B21EBCF
MYGKNHDKTVKDWAAQIHLEDVKERELKAEIKEMEETEFHSPEHLESLKEDLKQHNATRHSGFCITGDNIDLTITPRQVTRQNQKKSLHYFNHMAVKNRVSSMHLPADAPLGEASSFPVTEILPNHDDNMQLRTEMSILAGRVIAEHLPRLSWIKDHLPSLDHQYMKEMKKKSDIVHLGILMKNENSSDGIRDIMEHLHEEYVPGHGTLHPVPTVSSGDLLTIERESNMQAERRDEDDKSPSARFDGLIPTIDDFHFLANGYQAFYKMMYDSGSAGDIGTLYSARTILEANNVTKNPMNDINAAQEFLDKYTDALILAAAMTYFGLDTVESAPTKNIPQEDGDNRVMDVLGGFVDAYAIASEEDFEKARKEQLKCPYCGKNYVIKGTGLKSLRDHVDAKHSKVAVDDAVQGRGNTQYINEEDSVFKYACSTLGQCLLARNFEDARKFGDGGRIVTDCTSFYA